MNKSINKIAVINEFATQGKIHKKTDDDVNKFVASNSMTNKHGTWTNYSKQEFDEVHNESHKYNTGLVKKNTSIKNFKYKKSIINLTEEEKNDLIKKNISQMQTTIKTVQAFETLYEDVCEANEEYSKEVDSHVCHNKHGSWWDGTDMTSIRKKIFDKIKMKSKNKYIVT